MLKLITRIPKIGKPIPAFIFTLFCIHFSCISDPATDKRSQDLFSLINTTVQYSSVNYDFDGNIQPLKNTILSLSDNLKQSITPIEITGIVTIRSNFDFSDIRLGSSTDPTDRKVYKNCFFLQDSKAAMMILYDNDYNEDGIIDSNFLPDIGIAGDKISIMIIQAQKYGNSTNFVGFVTKFEMASYKLISKGNNIYTQSTQTSYLRDNIGEIFSAAGIVEQTPVYKEYQSESVVYDFQFVYQEGFVSTIKATDGTTFGLQISYDLAKGTMGNFNFSSGETSYNVKKGDSIEITGPLFIPKLAGTDNDIVIEIEDKNQVVFQ